MNDTEEKNYIFGIRSIIEAVEAGKTIDKLFIQKGLHNDLFAGLWKLVREKKINYKHVPLEKIIKGFLHLSLLLIFIILKM